MTKSRLAVGLATASLVALAAGTQTAFAASNHTRALTGDTPSWVAHAKKIGPTDPSKAIDFTVWLKLRNENTLHKQLHALYTKGSGSYHRWLSQAQFDAAYSPTDQQVRVTSHFLTAHGLTVGSVADNNFYVNVSGTVGQAEKAFHVQINNYRYHGKNYRSNAGNPSVATRGGGHIADISGLDNASVFRPLGQHARPSASPSDTTVYNQYQGLCGYPDTTHSVNYTDGTSQSLKGFVPCDGYNGRQLRTAYGLDKLPSSTDGSGQTVAIVDAYGSPTILQDANKFSDVAGLPPLNSANFQVVGPKGVVNKKESPAQDPLGWQGEVTLDVEAVHAMAPGAKIVLVAAPNNYADLDEAVNWVVVHHLANIVTNSWGLSVDLMSPGQGRRDERIFEQAAAEGVGLNFSSGDYGDESAFGGPKTVDFPASSPWVNAVGGTSLLLNHDGSYGTETGWGTWFNQLATCAKSSPVPGTVVAGTDQPQLKCDTYAKVNPFPTNLGFQFGAGGGLSKYYTAQPWQKQAIGSDTADGFGTVGTHRAVPDISMLADPYTGMEVWITDKAAGDTSPVPETYGGTSLASPLFAGIMADVDQARVAKGLPPTGLASQYEYGLLGTPAVRDVVSPSGIGNPAPNGPHPSDAMSLYYGSFHSGSLFRVGFNQDTSLDTEQGWDDVTGVGTPYAPAFVAALSTQQ